MRTTIKEEKMIKLYEVTVVIHQIHDVYAEDEDDAHNQVIQMLGQDSSWLEGLETDIVEKKDDKD